MKHSVAAFALLLLAACGGASPPANPHSTPPCRPANSLGSTLPQSPSGAAHVSWNDALGIASQVRLPQLATFWKGSVPPATTADEPLIAVCVDGQGRCTTRTKGSDWMSRTDSDLLHTLRLFGEESFNLDEQVSLCQVVLGADQDAPMSVILGIQEMFIQARIHRIYLLTSTTPPTLLLLDLSLSRAKPKDALLLSLDRSGDATRARLGETTVEGAKWAEELAEAAAQSQMRPAMLELSVSAVTMREVEAALNACAALGMTQVRLL